MTTRSPDNDAIDFDTNHDFAVAAWIKPAPAQVWTATVDIQRHREVVRRRRLSVFDPLPQPGGRHAGKIAGGRWDGQNVPGPVDHTYDDGRFHHVAFVKSGSTLLFTWTGRSRASGPTRLPAPRPKFDRCTSGGAAAATGCFTGSLDDVRVYPRALSAPEVQALFLSGWQPATVAQSGPNVEVTTLADADAEVGWKAPTASRRAAGTATGTPRPRAAPCRPGAGKPTRWPRG